MARFKVTLGITEIPPHSGIVHLTCEPAVLKVDPHDDIEFDAGGLPFSVVPKGLSPIGPAYIQSTGKPAEAQLIGPPGIYSLACAVFARGKIYIDAVCPSIIIDPGTQG